jgi:predicted amidophosphoribosyltransferase
MAVAGRDVEGADAVVPVPLHRVRERERGFNQARELARHVGITVLDALVRARRTATRRIYLRRSDTPTCRERSSSRPVSTSPA